MYSYKRKTVFWLLMSVLPMALFAKAANKQPYPGNIFIELVVGPTNKELLATARMIIHNNDPRATLCGGTYSKGKFAPSWKLYLNGQYKVAKTECKIDLSKPSNDASYCLITPTEAFGRLEPGSSMEIQLVSSTPFSGLGKISKSSNMAGVHISFDGQDEAHFIPLQVVMDDRAPGTFSRLPKEFCDEQNVCDEVPLDTPLTRYSKGVDDIPIGLQDRIVPKPYYLSQGKGSLKVETLGRVRAERPLFFEAQYLKDILKKDEISPKSIDISLKIADTLIPELDIEKNGKNIAEGYVLKISSERIEILGSDKAGVFYGVQTLRQLLAQAKIDYTNQLPIAVIVDAPRFPVRSHLLDVARHFVPKKDLLTYIDLLSQFKINQLHLHMSDDEGWRLEIPDLPELVEYGAKRSFSSQTLSPSFGTTTGLEFTDQILGKPANEECANFWVKPTWQGFEDAMNNFVGNGSGFYSTKDFEEILIYAAQRNIEIMCELDLPAHARAAIVAMESRYQKYKEIDSLLANWYRLIDPEDKSENKNSVVNPSLKSTYNFINKVFKEVKACYESAQVPFKALHIGCDEIPGIEDNSTWSLSPLFQATGMTGKELFIQFVLIENYVLNSLGAKAHIWAEALDIVREDKNSYELLKHTGMVAHPWNNIWSGPKQSACYELANDGFNVVLAHASNLYLDMMQAKHPQELGTNYAGFIGLEEVFSYMPENYAVSYIQKDFFGDPKNTLGKTLGQVLDPVSLIKTQAVLSLKNNILGIASSLWTESCKNYKSIEYMAFPRMIAQAERAWNRNPPVDAIVDPDLPEEVIRKKISFMNEKIARSWKVFANCLGKYTLPMLDIDQNVNYRIPLPGACLQDGLLLMNSEMPGFELQYSEDANFVWKTWHHPVFASGKVYLRALAKNGKASRIDVLE
jgi:hexosaminidase